MANPKWNSVALFFNLPSSIRPTGYSRTNSQDVSNFFDIGVDPAPIQLSDFVYNYWNTISYGKLRFGLETPRDASGNPIIPTLTPKNNDPMDWGDLIHKYLESYAEEVWIAAGKKIKNGARWIPSIALIQKYHVRASAGFSGFDKTIRERLVWRWINRKYTIGDITHIKFDLQKTNARNFPELRAHGRKFWGTLIHEYGHNFLEFRDLYGPQGTTGYWDLLGDNSPPGRMSEVSSVFKERIGWLKFKNIVKGPKFPKTNFSLRPYTTSGDAIKIIPDPDNNPHEFFILEYRKSTGNELWRPDGGLKEEGLLITHFNTRLGVAPVWLMREAPYFDPEFADFSDNGAALWTGHDRLDGILYPQGNNNSFTRTSKPSSNFYGNRASGLSIENIRTSSGKCRFSISISIQSYVGWYVSSRDKAIAGKFHGKNKPHTIFIRNNERAQMLRMIESQWFAVQSAGRWIGDWQLTINDKMPIVGDFDGDGKEELYFRDANRAGIIGFKIGSWKSLTVQSGWIDGWNLGKNDWETVADVDGDSQDEVVIRSAKWIGLLKLIGAGRNSRLKLLHIKQDKVGTWVLNNNDGIFGGYFRNKQKQDILITAKNDIGLIEWQPTSQKFKLVKKQHDRIDGWNIGTGNKFYVGDFDGDGLDEIYIRSPKWAGIIKWQNNRFNLLWIKQNFIDPITGNEQERISLTAADKSYKGKFLPDREGILHKSSDRISVLSWDGEAMKVRQTIKSQFGNRWQLGTNDQFVLGDFHTQSPDVGDPSTDYIGDGITDIFIHNSWGTGMVGVNYTEWNSTQRPGSVQEEMGLTWIQERKILTFITGG